MSPVFDRYGEAAVLGDALLSDRVVPQLLDMGLAPEHFYIDDARRVYRAMVSLYDQGIPSTDRTAILTEMGGDNFDRLVLANYVQVGFGAGAWHHHAQKVIEHAEWRRRESNANLLASAARAGDGEAYAAAESALLAGGKDTSSTWSIEDQAREAMAHLDNPRQGIALPLDKLSTLAKGGLRRGGVTLVGAHTNVGKSPWIDQCLAHATKQGKNTHLLINEMSPGDRVLRNIAREAHLPLDDVIAPGALTDGQVARYVGTLERLPFEITDCSGWSCADICRFIRRGGFDLVGLDLITEIPGASDRTELEEISRQLVEVVKPNGADCHLIVATHLNRNRVVGAAMPPPTLGDIRSTAMLGNRADIVCFIHRESDEDTGDPLKSGEGWVRFSKGRMCRRGGVDVIFDGDYQAFRAADWRDEA